MKSTNTSRKTNVVAQKATLAKLMATENIRVEHHRVDTARFNLQTRTLTLPVWEAMNGDLYDLLTGHEVGHALFTPMEGWHESVVQGAPGANFKHYLNVLEDARIEKLIKRKYPGLRRSFLNGYADLFERNFFGVKDYTTEKLNKTLLVDRLNLYFKVGAHLMIQFTAAEAKFVARAEALETFEEVDALAREVYAYDREQLNRDKKKEKAKQKPQESETKKPNEEVEEERADAGETEAEETSEQEDFEVEASDDEGEDEELLSSEGGEANGDGEEEDEEDPESITDRNFRANEGSLVNTRGAAERNYIDLPNCNLGEAIISNEELRNVFLADAIAFVDDLTRENGAYVNALRSEFKENNGKFVDLMVKEFEMRKNASQYARQRTARSGELDTKKLANYRFTGDIFKRLTTVEKGKSHGMVLFLDMSGSMMDNIKKTVDQLLVLVSFCKKANIPFDVYGFSDHRRGVATREAAAERARKIFGDCVGYSLTGYSDPKSGNFQLNHLISSNLSERHYKDSFDMMLLFGSLVGYVPPKQFSLVGHSLGNFKATQKYLILNGTPLSETIIASRKIIENFRTATQTQIVTAVYLTDGDGNAMFSIPNGDRKAVIGDRKAVITDPITKLSVEARSSGSAFIQDALIKLVGKLTGCNTMNFYLTSKKDVSYKAKYWYKEAGFASQDEAKKFANDNNYLSVNDYRGFDRYFFIDAEIKSEDGEFNVGVGVGKGKIVSEFKKFNHKKKTNRALAVSVIDVVAA